MSCGAKRKNGDPCHAKSMANGRCRIHGGLTPVGMAHPNTKYGRYSKYLPARLAARYQEAQSDGELISLREEIGLVDARLADVLGRVDTKEAGVLWAGIGKAVEAYRREDDPAKQAEAFATIEALSSEGQDDYAAWSEVLGLVERRRKLAETETKRLQAIGQTITAERAMLMLAAVVDVITRHVTDRDTLASISRDVGKLVAIPVRFPPVRR